MQIDQLTDVPGVHGFNDDPTRSISWVEYHGMWLRLTHHQVACTPIEKIYALLRAEALTCARELAYNLAMSLSASGPEELATRANAAGMAINDFMEAVAAQQQATAASSDPGPAPAKETSDDHAIRSALPAEDDPGAASGQPL